MWCCKPTYMWVCCDMQNSMVHNSHFMWVDYHQWELPCALTLSTSLLRTGAFKLWLPAAPANLGVAQEWQSLTIPFFAPDLCWGLGLAAISAAHHPRRLCAPLFCRKLLPRATLYKDQVWRLQCGTVALCLYRTRDGYGSGPQARVWMPRLRRWWLSCSLWSFMARNE